MVVLNGTAAGGTDPGSRLGLAGFEMARFEMARFEMDRVEAAWDGADAAAHGDGLGEVWYYVSSSDRYSRRIEGGAGRNHIVLWARNAASTAGALPAGYELGSQVGADGVLITYGPGADPATATITMGSAGIVFDPRTIADVIVWVRESRVGRRHQGRFTWNRAARGGAGAFVLAGHIAAGPDRDGGVK